ncbi:hypothetical protein [Alicyclobacillus sp. ALC3]|uniref:hypothetical protein n=1 Tax=Alicyclobacillus sp. ALC3 TaxID=2796143 RepID=UPI003FCCB81A
MNTLIKVGSLAFDVVQDEKIRALATMVHHGGRRRGLWGQPPSTGSKAAVAKPEPQPAEPSAPKEKSSGGKAPGRIRIPFELNPGERLPWQTGGPMFGVPLGKYVKGGNGKKAMHYAGTLGKMLLK